MQPAAAHGEAVGKDLEQRYAHHVQREEQEHRLCNSQSTSLADTRGLLVQKWSVLEA